MAATSRGIDILHLAISRISVCRPNVFLTEAIEEITQQVLQLPSRQHLVLAGLLLEMGESGDHPDVDDSWEQETQDRLKAVDSGAVVGISYGDAMREADQIFAS